MRVSESYFLSSDGKSRVYAREYLPDREIKPTSLQLLHQQAVFFTTSATWEAPPCITVGYKCIDHRKTENSYRENP